MQNHLNSDEIQSLSRYLPAAAMNNINKLFNELPIQLKITRERKTKHGDFRPLPNGHGSISVNGSLNPYHFLITLVHELAHVSVHRKYNRRKKPHGSEWKAEMRRLMLPFLNNDVFPNDILPYLAQYLQNPKASTGSDISLSLALKKYDPDKGKVCIFELSEGDEFLLNGKVFILGNKKRTRYECQEKNTGKKYLIHRNAEVEVNR